MQQEKQITAVRAAMLLLSGALLTPARVAAEDDAAAAASPAPRIVVAKPAVTTSEIPLADVQPAGLIDGAASADVDLSHPLQPVLQQAASALQRFDQQVRDYECLMIKRERIDGQLTPHQFLRVKIRQRQADGDAVSIPFSVYARFLKPSDVEGRELLYVENQRNGDLLVRRGGPQLPNLTLQLDPKGKLAMSQSRYPITHIGIRQLITQMIDRIEEQMPYHDCHVHFFDRATLDGRPCDHIHVRHEVRRPDLPYHSVRVLIDRQWQMPVYFASYDWPEEPDGQPVLQEEYVYTKLKINPGLTDRDFERENPAYSFRTLTPEQTAAN